MGATIEDLGLLSMFGAVAEASSFTVAAARLGVSKGTVSRGISRLEAVVGAQLLHRTSRQVALSTAGVALYERTAPLLMRLREALGAMPEREEQPSGELRITAPVDLGVTLLPGLVAGFSLRYPAVRVDVRLTNRVVDLVGEGFDLAIRAAGRKLRDSSLVVRKLGGSDMRYYASPSYVARRRAPQRVGDPDHEWVLFTPLTDRMPKGLRQRCRIVSDDLSFVREVLCAGAGVGPLPWFLAEPQVASGGLVQVLDGVRLPAGEFVLLYPSSSGQVPRKVSAFRDYLVEGLRARPIAP